MPRLLAGKQAAKVITVEAEPLMAGAKISRTPMKALATRQTLTLPQRRSDFFRCCSAQRWVTCSSTKRVFELLKTNVRTSVTRKPFCAC